MPFCRVVGKPLTVTVFVKDAFQDPTAVISVFENV
jgi:hypothetical protein